MGASNQVGDSDDYIHKICKPEFDSCVIQNVYRKNYNQLTEDIEVPEEMAFMGEEHRQMEAQSTFKDGRVRGTQGSGYKRVYLEFIACLGNS